MSTINYKLSVIVITYNQEQLISRALDSIIIQKEWGLFEIIVCDDCSIDNTYAIVKHYSDKYPSIVKPFRNDHNLGIYGNLKKSLTRIGNTDLVIMCSGDDALCDGYLRAINEAIESYNIDTHGVPFTIYSDWQMIDVSGKSRVFHNNLISKHFNPVSLKIRGLIFNRSTCSSTTVYQHFSSVPLDRGVSVAESLFDIQVQLHSQINYYLPYIGSIYYSGLGVSTKMVDVQHKQEYIDAMFELKRLEALNPKDSFFLDYQIYKTRFSIRPSLNDLIFAFKYYFKSIDFSYGFRPMTIIHDLARLIIKHH